MGLCESSEKDSRHMRDLSCKEVADLREGYQALRLSVDLLLQDGAAAPLEVLHAIERSADRTLGALDHIIANSDDRSAL